MPKKKKESTENTLQPADASAKGTAEQIVAGFDALDEKQRKAVVVLAEAGFRIGQTRRNGAVSLAGSAAGVGRHTIYNWLKIEAFADALEACNQMFVTECLQALRMNAISGDTRAICERLIVLDPEAFDRQMARDKMRWEHEERMLDKRIAAGIPAGDERPLPDFSYVEAPPGTPPPKSSH